MVKLSLDVPQETYERLSKLSEHYKKEVSEITLDLISVPTSSFNSLIRLSEEYIAPYPLTAVLHHIFDAGIFSTDSIFNKLLELLDAKGRFTQDDMEINIDDFRLWVDFSGLVGSDFLIDSFDITLESYNVRLTARSDLDQDEVNEDVVAKLRTMIEDKEEFNKIELPEEFYDTEEFEIDLIEDEIITLQIDMTSESLSYLPKIPIIDSFIQNLYRKAGIN